MKPPNQAIIYSANLVPRAHVSFGQHHRHGVSMLTKRHTGLWNEIEGALNFVMVMFVLMSKSKSDLMIYTTSDI